MPVTIEYFADQFPAQDIIFVTDDSLHNQDTQRVARALLDQFPKVHGCFWFILKDLSGNVLKAFPTNRIPTCEFIAKSFGSNHYEAYIFQPEKKVIVLHFSV